MKHGDELRRIMENPEGYAARLKNEQGLKIVGTLCTYAPEEIIMAGGAHPFRLLGTGGKTRLADSHLQSYCCSPVRGMLEDALSGRLDFLDGVVFTHTCDTMQRFSDIWRMNVTHAFHMDVIIPVKLNTESARSYFIDVLQVFRLELGRNLGVEISDEDLREAIKTGNRIRTALLRAGNIARDNPSLVGGSELYALSRAAMIMQKGELAGWLEEIVGELEEKSANLPSGNAKRIFLAGGVCSHPDIYAMIEEAGGAVTGDDLCTGSRYFSGLIDEANPDPIAAIAERYMERIACPAKHRGIDDRGARLVEMARASRADGVIFFFLKFCDPHAFDYPWLRGALEKAGIPCMMVEAEDQLPSEGQLATRIEAFIEMI
jgi:bzd-type benzoyl-CoA reductase N subunit